MSLSTKGKELDLTVPQSNALFFDELDLVLVVVLCSMFGAFKFYS